MRFIKRYFQELKASYVQDYKKWQSGFWIRLQREHIWEAFRVSIYRTKRKTNQLDDHSSTTVSAVSCKLSLELVQSTYERRFDFTGYWDKWETFVDVFDDLERERERVLPPLK